ncbi:Dipeptidyl aminopeptidase/acylaminoacyl peptidase [Chishuiella changwenlii]|uniref:Dipeptidyl aminopeptidase/acylaminoacyl peptidase n=1 Tax=Chishuiella changwenlii TaxID=1434701 RepID=A0A1M7CZB4_9FLAO|nr:S9 family peptidase [Chishuiella changwenlii]GGF10600.1 peptidase S9 [Chishuiella changwenlii]SHL72568.1 Dipeptidyl aminopeptidase/acylaminoacyl peptidase [Chishuiella changwenlii]
MNKITLLVASILVTTTAMGQKVMTPELLWQVKKVSPIGVTKDQKNLIYKVTSTDVKTQEDTSKTYMISLAGGKASEVQDYKTLLDDKSLNKDQKYKAETDKVKLEKVFGSDYYPAFDKSNVQIYDALNYRHWDTWNDGNYEHLFVSENKDNATKVDVLKDEPFAVSEFVWTPDGTKVLYVSKKKSGTNYALSTNTDIFQYDLVTKKTTNITEGKMGYDNTPSFSSQGDFAFLSMERDGYEADKNDLIVRKGDIEINLTKNWDGTVQGYKWSNDGKKIYFNAPVGGTIQLFEVDVNFKAKKLPTVKQITKGDFDIADLKEIVGNKAIVTKTDINHAAEIYSVDLKSGALTQLTNENKEIFESIALSDVKARKIKTTDGKEMHAWVVYPPNFDPNKKYPTLLYCQGGPQSALTQFYSPRWNFQLMAAQGYIVIAPNRRGMPGHGVEWNEQISKDWGGQVMQDYLAAIDDISKESYVDKDRRGAVGASYGGYSVYYLAGIHEGRFKSFIAHNGVFDLKSMYGTTEEIFFTNWDAGGAWWEKDNKAAQKTYAQFDPSSTDLVNKWNTPMLIYVGGRDYRVPMGQGQEAYQILQLKGIKSRFIYFPEENHWVLKPQNSVIWHSEFFKWLKETL